MREWRLSGVNFDKIIKILGVVLTIAAIVYSTGRLVGEFQFLVISVTDLSTSVKELTVETVQVRMDNANLNTRISILENAILVKHR